jgi:hypothetical protein
LVLVVPLFACPAGDDTGGLSTGSTGGDTGNSSPSTSNTTAPTTVDPDSSSSVTDPTSGSTGGTTTIGGESTTDGELCEIMIPPPGECPFAAPVGGRRLAGGSPAAHFDAELDFEAEPDEVQGGAFIMPPDVGEGTECDIWTQNCADGEKCMPWANDGLGSWNATHCSPLDPAPVGIGEECVVQGSGVSGIDNCDIGQMCWGVDGATNLGHCIELCSCDPSFPVCNTANTLCTVTNDGVLPLCLPACNPLDPTACADNEGCYDAGDGFQCAPDASGAQGAPGDACEFLNVCDPGNFCASSGSVPGCGGSTGCCSPFCTIGDDAACLDGQSCVPWFEEGAAPDECLATIGACVQ